MSKNKKDENKIMGKADGAFETVTAFIALCGKGGGEHVFNTLTRNGVTPAEYVILQILHGKNNVSVVKKGELATDKIETSDGRRLRYRSHEDELDRLRDYYGISTFKRAYPHEMPMLPRTFEAAGIQTDRPDNVRALRRDVTAEDHAREIARVLDGIDEKDEDEGAGAA